MDPLIKSQLLYQLSYTPTPPGKPSVGGHIAAGFGDVQPCRIISRQIAELPQASNKKPAFRHLDGVAADARGDQFSGLDVELEPDARRPAHFQPLLDPEL